jgi:nucleoside-diphosphate-sugar epimerase
VLSLTPAGTPVVVTSSSSVYGGAVCGPGGLRACHEDDLPRPRSAYARAKVEVERLCRRRRERAGPVVVARPFTVVGPGQRPDMVVATWIDAARTGAPVRLFGSTEVRRDVTDVAEVARALVALAERPAPGVVNVGTGHAVTLAGLLGAVAAATGRPLDVAIVPAPAEDPPATLADTRRLARALGWVPRTDLVDVVARQAAAPSMTAPASASSARARLTAVERGRLRPPPRPRWRLRPPPRPLARADRLRSAPNLGRWA